MLPNALTAATTASHSRVLFPSYIIRPLPLSSYNSGSTPATTSLPQPSRTINIICTGASPPAAIIHLHWPPLRTPLKPAACSGVLYRPLLSPGAEPTSSLLAPDDDEGERRRKPRSSTGEEWVRSGQLYDDNLSSSTLMRSMMRRQPANQPATTEDEGPTSADDGLCGDTANF